MRLGKRNVPVVAVVAALLLGSLGSGVAFAGDDSTGDSAVQSTAVVDTRGPAVTDGRAMGGQRAALGSGEVTAAVVPVTGCRVIDSPGRYELRADIVDARALDCIQIRSSDVVFDGNGHTIDAVELNQFTPRGIAVRPERGVTVRNVTVRNVTATEFWGGGVVFFRTEDGVVSDVTLRDSGLRVSHSEVTVRDVDVSNPGDRYDFGVRVLGTGSTATLRDVSVSGARFGYRFLRSDGHTLVNVSAVDSREFAFRFDESGSNRLEDVSVVDSGGRGIEFVDSGDNTLTDVSVSDSGAEGVYFERSGGNTLEEVSVADAEVGLLFRNDSGGNRLEEVFTSDTELDGLQFVDSGRNSLEDVFVDDAGRNGIAFADGSTASALVDVTVIDSGLRGVALSRADGTTLEDVTVVDGGVGVWIDRSDGVVLSRVVVENTTVEEGIRIAASEDATVRDTRVLGGAFVGLHVVGSDDVRVADLAVERTEAGIVVSNADEVTIANVSVADSDENGVTVDASTEVSVRNTTVLRSGAWDLSLTDSTDDLSVEDLTTESATLSLAGRDVAVAAVDSPPPDPTSPERHNAGVHVNTTTTGADGYADLVVAYDDAADVDESTLGLWRFDGSAWTEVPGSTTDPTADEVSATVTEFGVFAPLGVEASTPDGGDSEANEPPVADFVVSSATPETRSTVQFDASASIDPDGSVSSYEWDFDGDGRTDATRASPGVNHTYTRAGTFAVSLTVIDDAGHSNTTTRTVTVTEVGEGGSGDGGGDATATVTTAAATETATTPPSTTRFAVPFRWWLALALLVVVAAVYLVRTRA
jgi:parallel beta-helix repeat protein